MNVVDDLLDFAFEQPAWRHAYVTLKSWTFGQHWVDDLENIRSSGSLYFKIVMANQQIHRFYPSRMAACHLLAVAGLFIASA